MIPWNDCIKRYVGQTGRKLEIWVHKHKLELARRNQLSLFSIHEDESGSTFNWDKTPIVGHGSTKQSREFIQSWYSSGDAISERIDMKSSYERLRSMGFFSYGGKTLNNIH